MSTSALQNEDLDAVKSEDLEAVQDEKLKAVDVEELEALVEKDLKALESEDMVNVPLVPMVDVQPPRTYGLASDDEQEVLLVLDTCLIEEVEYDNECILNDDEDSNTGSMVSLHSEGAAEMDSEPEMIVPEMIDDSLTSNSVLRPITKYQGFPVNEDDDRKAPTSWPTLEILPGGVIQKPEKPDRDPQNSSSSDEYVPKVEEMSYACAKCPQSFKFLFCLVKHVREHEDEARKLDEDINNKPTKHREKLSVKNTKKRKVLMHAKPHKKKTPKKQNSKKRKS